MSKPGACWCRSTRSCPKQPRSPDQWQELAERLLRFIEASGAAVAERDPTVANAVANARRILELAGKEFFSDADAADYESLAKYLERLQARFGDGEASVTGEANGIWRSPRRIGPDRRTSVITQPANGKLPPLTPFALARVTSTRATRGTTR